uniref:Tim44-like domain-containing protein n=1 Tax=Biomphalaria glabrata TaxID=6526 RepID=A0A2C9LS58_BIOGL
MTGEVMEIILYAIIAVAIFIRLHGILGRIDDSYVEDGDFNNMNDGFVKSNYSENDNELIDDNNLLQIISAINKGYVLEKLKQIYDIDKTFNPLNFIKSAEIAYEMIIGGFTKGDKDKLKMLVNGDLLNKLFDMIKKREEKNEVQETTIVSVDLCNIED